MQRLLTGASAALLVANVFVLGLLYWQGPGGSAGPRVSESQFGQVEKLFSVLSDFHKELESVTGQATYADDKEKAAGKKVRQDESIAYSLCRLDYERARRSRGVNDVHQFLVGALYSRGFVGSGALDVPYLQRFVPAVYDQNFRQVKEADTVSYANVSKLESLQEQFRVLAQSLLDDLK